MISFYRFIVTLLALVLLIAILKRDEQDENTVAEPAPKTFVSRFGNAVSHKPISQINKELDEALEESKLKTATRRLG